MKQRTLREKLRLIRKWNRTGAIDASESFVQMAMALQAAGRLQWSRRRLLNGVTFSIRAGDRFVNLGNNGIRFVRNDSVDGVQK